MRSRARVAGSFDNIIRQISLTKNQIIHRFNRHTKGVTCLAVNTNGQKIVSGSFDSTIIVYPTHTLTGHSAAIYSLAISPDDTTLVSASQDKEIKIWNLITGELINTLTEHSAPVLSVAISPD